MNAQAYGTERILRFGSGNGLVGILNEGVADGRPAVVFLNSGILHRVGACRLHVRMARALSAAGFYCLRFDFSGIGDSEQRRDALPFEESAPLEALDAMDRIQRLTGINRFLLIGLCSGADMAHRTALRDPRVVGLHLLDAWAYRNLRYYWHHYGPRALKLSSWTNAVRVRVASLVERFRRRRTPSVEGVEYDLPTYTRVFPPRDDVARDQRALVARGVQMRLLWTGGLSEYNHLGQHAEQFRDVPFGSALEEDFLPQADHIITDLDHQETVIRRAVDWATRLWPSPNSSSHFPSSHSSVETAMRRSAVSLLFALSFLSACTADSPSGPRLAGASTDLVGDYNNTFGIVAGVVNVCAFFPASAGVGVATATFTASGPADQGVLAGAQALTPVPHCIEVWNALGTSTVEISATLQSQTAGYELDRIVRITGDGAGSEWATPLYGVTSASVTVSNLIGGAIWFKFRDADTPTSGGEGCTPGYWRQSQHFDSWPTPYLPTTLFGSVFANAFPGMTLAQVLALNGGGLDALGRHAVAALLNAANDDVDFDLTAAAVITAFNTAYATGDRGAMTAQKDIFDMLNNQGCPLN